MTANSRINIERLTIKDRVELEGIAFELWALAKSVEKLRDRFQGKLHTRLDKVRLGLDDAIEAIELVEVCRPPPGNGERPWLESTGNSTDL